MVWRGEVEDGSGWGGLVASKAEQREEARLAALERDAGRYRWLRTSGSPEIYLHHLPGVDNCKQIAGEGMDAAIDAAMNGANY